MAAKGSAKPKTSTVNLGGNLHLLDRPWVMGILNLTANSFYDGGRYTQLPAIVERCQEMLEEGADIIDLGANSTKPGAPRLTNEQEQKMLLPALRELKSQFPEAIFSIDTFNADTAEKAIASGAHIINDVSGGNLDEQMFPTLAQLKVPYICMHMQGDPSNMQQNPTYGDVTREIMNILGEKVAQLHALGLNDIWLDVGFGFGKTLEHNYTLLRELHYFHALGKPLLVGLSRKSMLYKPLGKTAEAALAATTAAHVLALQKGAQILRVHDVAAAKDAIGIVECAAKFA